MDMTAGRWVRFVGFMTAGWLLAAHATAGDEATATPDATAAAAPVAVGANVARLRFEPIGLSIPSPYTPGKVPVVFIPGLWMGPQFWDGTIRTLASDPALSAAYQFWTFGYATQDPLAYSAYQLRTAIEEARRRLDPEAKDPALDRMVLVGHSMGGVIARLAVVEAGDRFWRLASDQDAGLLTGGPGDVELARATLLFRPCSTVRRVVFLATPHRGGDTSQRLLHDAARRLALRPAPLADLFRRLAEANPPGYFKPSFFAGVTTSTDDLRHDSPLLAVLAGLSPPSSVSFHSIIAVKNGPMGPGGDDGLVSYDSAHLDGVASELVAASSHFSCHNDPAALAEVRRILLENLDP